MASDQLVRHKPKRLAITSKCRRRCLFDASANCLAHKALDDRNVWIDLETGVESIGSDTISLLYKGQVDTIPVDLVLWTVGTRVANVVRSLPLKQNNRGQLTTAPTLQVVDHPEIFALGDLADSRDVEGQQVPSTAQAAFQQADYTAWNIWASLTGRPLLPFRYQHLGEMMTLGINNATFTGAGVKLDGSLAYISRRLAYLYCVGFTASLQTAVHRVWCCLR
jgi:NADH:ubiquinone reductase (non-electrogenic)